MQTAIETGTEFWNVFKKPNEIFSHHLTQPKPKLFILTQYIYYTDIAYAFWFHLAGKRKKLPLIK